MIVSRPQHPNERDLLLEHKDDSLSIQNLESIELACYHAPEQGWTHDALECVDYSSVSPDGWEAYLGEQWIGSSEV